MSTQPGAEPENNNADAVLPLLHITAHTPHFSLAPNSIQTWAMAEAKARMEARGEATEYKPSSV